MVWMCLVLGTLSVYIVLYYMVVWLIYQGQDVGDKSTLWLNIATYPSYKMEFCYVLKVRLIGDVVEHLIFLCAGCWIMFPVILF